MRGGLAEEVKAQSPPLEQWRRFEYCESLAGESFGSVDHFKVQLSLHADVERLGDACIGVHCACETLSLAYRKDHRCGR